MRAAAQGRACAALYWGEQEGPLREFVEERVRTTGRFSSQRGETSGPQGPRSQGKVKNRIAGDRQQ